MKRSANLRADTIENREMGTMAATSQLVIIPAWNESGTIRQVVDGLRECLPDADVVVIDDGSTDATARSVPAWAKVLRLPFNLGIGGAMQTGYRYAAINGYQVAIQVDADGQHAAEEVEKILEPVQKGEADIVVGSRFLDESSDQYPLPLTRRIGILWLSLLLKLLTGRRFTDCTSGFRAANRRVIEAYARWYPDDYPEPEVILLLHRAKFRVTEVPVRMNERAGGHTSISLGKGVYYVIKVSVALALDMIREPWREGGKL